MVCTWSFLVAIVPGTLGSTLGRTLDGSGLGSTSWQDRKASQRCGRVGERGKHEVRVS